MQKPAFKKIHHYVRFLQIGSQSIIIWFFTHKIFTVQQADILVSKNQVLYLLYHTI